MAETTTTRLGLRRWSAGTDTPSRAEFDTSFGNLELLTAIDKQDTFANRPAAGVRGTYFWDTTNSVLWRDSGSAWSVVGAKFLDGLAKGSTTSSVPLTVDTFGASQTGNLLEVKNNGTNYFTITAAGNTTAQGTFAAKSAAFTNATAANVVIDGQGATSQSAALLRLRNDSGVNRFTVAADGSITSPYFSNAAAGNGSIVNASTASNVTGLATWSGTPAFEVRMNNSGFGDFMYLKHAAAPGTAVDRRIGLLMKADDEGSAGRTGSMSIRSTLANFDAPSMQFHVQDALMWDWQPNTTGSYTTYPVQSIGGFFKSQPNNTGAFHASLTQIGTQNVGQSMYFRTFGTSDQFTWYGGGVHSNTLNDPGSGGQLWATLDANKFVTNRVWINATDDVNQSQTNPPMLIGPLNAQNLMFDSNEIAGINNGVIANGELGLQMDGGLLRLGGSGTTVRINGHPLYFSSDGANPPYTFPSMIWFDARSGGGIKRWNGSSWVAF